MVEADTAKVTSSPPISPELLSLPPIALENILQSASFSGAIAACSCRALRDAWRGLTSSNPEFAATALVDRFKTADAAAEHLYEPEPALLGDPLVKSNIAAPAPGILDVVASPLLSILSALLKKRPPILNLGYLAATGASDAYALRLLRHLSSLREGTRREANPAAVSQPNNDDDVEDANEDGAVAGQEHEDDGPVADQEQAVRTRTLFPPGSVLTGAASAGHEATVVELLRQGGDPVVELLPGAVRSGNARLCAALLEGGRMAGATCGWADGSVLGIRGNPSGFVDSYASSEKATWHMGYMCWWLLPLTYIDPPLGPGGGKGGARGSDCGGRGGDGSSSSGNAGGGDGSADDACVGRVSARGLFQRAVGWWRSGGAGPVQPAEDVAVALAAARAAAEHAADTALGDSYPLLPLLVQSSTAAAGAAAAAATAAALAALTPAEASCGGSSSSSSGVGSGSSGGGGGSGAHTSGQACAFLSSTTNHAAVRQLLLQWRPAEGRDPQPIIRASVLPCAAVVGAWPVVSELLRAGIDPRDTRAPATVLYLALVQGRGAMAAWLLGRLLAHPAIVWKGIVGAVFAALVTRVMGIASPLQQLLRYKPMSFFEKMLLAIGHVVVFPLSTTLIPFLLLPTRVFTLWSLCKTLASCPKWRR